MFKVKNEKELTSLLKLISEEAVSYTKQKLNEDDNFDNVYKALRTKEKQMFEQEETEDKESLPEETPVEKKPQDVEKNLPEEETVSDSKPSEEKFSGSKDRLVDFVNDIRSAPSLKDSAVDEQVSAYYDRLTEEERNVMVFFLRELSRVMTGKATGKEARDPSDPPLNINFVVNGSDQDKEEPKAEKDSAALPEEMPDIPEEQELEDDQEDTVPPINVPIKVNENQDHTLLRSKIRKLFK